VGLVCPREKLDKMREREREREREQEARFGLLRKLKFN